MSIVSVYLVDGPYDGKTVFVSTSWIQDGVLSISGTDYAQKSVYVLMPNECVQGLQGYMYLGNDADKATHLQSHIHRAFAKDRLNHHVLHLVKENSLERGCDIRLIMFTYALRYVHVLGESDLITSLMKRVQWTDRMSALARDQDELHFQVCAFVSSHVRDIELELENMGMRSLHPADLRHEQSDEWEMKGYGEGV